MELMDTKNKLKSLWPLVIFFIAFYVIDVGRLYLEHTTDFHINRIFTWLIPIFLFIIFVLKKNPVKFLKLWPEVNRGVFCGIIISAVHIFLYCSLRYWWNNTLTINFNVTLLTFLDHSLFAGLVEEIMFRGLILQTLNEVFNFKTSNILNAILFVLMHIPYWYFGTQFSLPLASIIYDFFFIFVVGLFWGFVTKKTNSLWTSIIHHSVNNALVILIR